MKPLKKRRSCKKESVQVSVSTKLFFYKNMRPEILYLKGRGEFRRRARGKFRHSGKFENKAGYTATKVVCGWAGAIFEVT